MRRYYECLVVGQNVFVAMATVKRMGLGIFAQRDMTKRCRLRLFGNLRRITHKQNAAMTEEDAACAVQLGTRGNCIDWYEMDGPASLLNHRCRAPNVEYAFEDRDADGTFWIRLLKDVKEGEELVVHYGDSYWLDRREKCVCRPGCTKGGH